MSSSIRLFPPLLALLFAAPAVSAPDAPAEIVLAQGETLATIASRHLGSADAAVELRALNGLAPESEPAAGARLKLPGPERARLVARLAELEGTAADEVKQALELMRKARYAEALALLPADSTSRFTVEVERAGGTTVTVRSGPAIAVEAAGTAQRVEQGHAVTVREGEPPPAPERSLTAPTLAEPANDAKVEAPAAGELLGPIALRWSAVEGAERYVVVVSADAEGRRIVARLEATSPDARIAKLEPGRYFWRVTAAAGQREITSPVHGFRLVPAPPRLEVQKPKWK